MEHLEDVLQEPTNFFGVLGLSFECDEELPSYCWTTMSTWDRFNEAKLPYSGFPFTVSGWVINGWDEEHGGEILVPANVKLELVATKGLKPPE